MMPTFRGNRGNLLQHWVLVELATILKNLSTPPVPQLCFIDAHAMAPLAARHPSPGQTAQDFDAVRNALPGQQSPYEIIWLDSVTEDRATYPSSAVFVRAAWNRSLNLVLCEHDANTVQAIRFWLGTLDPVETPHELHPGDWRDRFRRGMPTYGAAYLLSFDPFMFDRHGPGTNPRPGNMYPQDLLRVGAALLELPQRPTIVQLSTYSANNGNRQDDVISAVCPVFDAAGYLLVSCVRADGNMMSLVFSRHMPDPTDFLDLPDRFNHWLATARRGPEGA
jgi:hypothetical protein